MMYEIASCNKMLLTMKNTTMIAKKNKGGLSSSGRKMKTKTLNATQLKTPVLCVGYIKWSFSFYLSSNHL